LNEEKVIDMDELKMPALTDWLGVLTVVALVAFVGHEVWRRRLRRRFLRERRLLTDTAFCQAVAAASQEEPWWVELRRALAAQCGLPAEMVCPDDALDTLETMTFDGWDFHELICTLEERLNIPIRRVVEEHPQPGESSETVRGLGECLAKTIRAFGPTSENGE
jgi:hypothetical protein